MIMSTCPVTSGNENDSQVGPDENHSQTELHYVTFDAIEDTLTFTCRGDDTAKCHHYPDCGCETWSDDHEHPAVLHDRCWMQDWFDSLGVSYDGDQNISGFGPDVSGSGFVDTEFEDDYILWSWAS